MSTMILKKKTRIAATRFWSSRKHTRLYWSLGSMLRVKAEDKKKAMKDKKKKRRRRRRHEGQEEDGEEEEEDKKKAMKDKKKAMKDNKIGNAETHIKVQCSET